MSHVLPSDFVYAITLPDIAGAKQSDTLDLLFDFTIYALQVCPSFLSTHELHISLSGRKTKRHNIFIALVRIHKYYIIERLESVIQWNL
jgi:hypothetical protein